jgi:hypothetical protein
MLCLYQGHASLLPLKPSSQRDDFEFVFAHRFDGAKGSVMQKCKFRSSVSSTFRIRHSTFSWLFDDFLRGNRSVVIGVKRLLQHLKARPLLRIRYGGKLAALNQVSFRAHADFVA